jgi:hypothetical protein
MTRWPTRYGSTLSPIPPGWAHGPLVVSGEIAALIDELVRAHLTV